jgi:hypothetical protein
MGVGSILGLNTFQAASEITQRAARQEGWRGAGCAHTNHEIAWLH